MQTLPPEFGSLAALRSAGFEPRGIREEMRSKLLAPLRDGRHVFNGMHGYD
jgi:hypothetical protein